jgi:hypothetical protein
VATLLCPIPLCPWFTFREPSRLAQLGGTLFLQTLAQHLDEHAARKSRPK